MQSGEMLRPGGVWGVLYTSYWPFAPCEVPWGGEVGDMRQLG